MTDTRATPWTPGPWRAYGHEIRGSYPGGSVLVCRINQTASPADTRANVRLIAAAPALAEALAQIAAILDQPVQHSSTTAAGTVAILRGDAAVASKVARTALAAARGEE